MALAASLLALPGLLVQPSLRPSGVVRLQRASAPAMEDEGFKMPDLPDIPNPFGGGGGGSAGGGGGGDGESPFAMISKMAEAGRLERLPNGGRGPKPNERFPDEAILDAIVSGDPALVVGLAREHAGGRGGSRIGGRPTGRRVSFCRSAGSRWSAA